MFSVTKGQQVRMNLRDRSQFFVLDGPEVRVMSSQRTTHTRHTVAATEDPFDLVLFVCRTFIFPIVWGARTRAHLCAKSSLVTDAERRLCDTKLPLDSNEQKEFQVPPGDNCRLSRTRMV